MKDYRTRMLQLKAQYGVFWNLFVGSAIIVVIFISGIAAYMLIEGWDFLSSFYMVVITLASVGYMEVHPLSDAGRIMTAVLILSGVGGFLYVVGSFSQVLVEGSLQKLWGRRRVQKTIAKLENHFIVCGFGRIGRIVTKEIMGEGHPVVVIEQNEAQLQGAEAQRVLFVQGDATKDEILLSAGLKKAKSLITALSDEAANVYVALSTRQLNPDLLIVARADNESHIARLKLAGADRVVMPHIIGGVRMAQSVLRPTVTNFLELAMRKEQAIDLQMEELLVTSGSELVGKDLIDSQIRPRFNLMIIAIKRRSGEMSFNPGPKEVIGEGDTLLAVGRSSDLERLQVIL